MSIILHKSQSNRINKHSYSYLIKNLRLCLCNLLKKNIYIKRKHEDSNLDHSNFFFFFFFWPCCVAYEMLVPRPGIEPRPPAVRVQSPYYQTDSEFPKTTLILDHIFCPQIQYQSMLVLCDFSHTMSI